MKVGELFVALGFDVDDKKLKDFNEEVKSGMAGMLKLVGVMSGAAFAVNAFVSGSVQTSVALKNFREETGYASDDVERFNNVIARLNPSVGLEQTIGLFRTLSDVIADAKLGGQSNQLAGLLGLDDIGNKTPLEILKALRQAYRNRQFLDEDTFRTKMGDLGIGSEFMMAIKATDQEFNDLFNKPILGEENRRKLEEIAEAQAELALQWQILRGELSAEISDEIVVFMQNLIPVMLDVIGNFKALGMAISDAFYSLTPEQQQLLLAGAVALGAGLAAAFAPVTTALTTILFLLNEIGKGMQGKSTLVSDLSDYAENLTDYLSGGKLSAAALPQPVMRPDTDFSRMAARGEFVVNNVWNIASQGDAMVLSDMIARKEKQTLDAVLTQQNRGIVQ